MIVQRGGPISLRKSRGGDQILDEQVRLILARTVAGSGPRVAFRENVEADGRWRSRARPHTPLDTVREDDQTSAPIRGHLDQVVCAAEDALTADRRALSPGGRRVGPWHVQGHEGEAQREEPRERAP
jgi:hypothetical protein